MTLCLTSPLGNSIREESELRSKCSSLLLILCRSALEMTGYGKRFHPVRYRRVTDRLRCLH